MLFHGLGQHVNVTSELEQLRMPLEKRCRLPYVAGRLA